MKRSRPRYIPYKCPSCKPATYYGILKMPGVKLTPCPNCDTTLVRCQVKE